ncbi:hypothetical protein C8J57DRAFT_1223298 [Mycena rebaudengoi]|nr:hypothetical protein C8J57DRAFT_1223298 [Mycena rebaudengoi]
MKAGAARSDAKTLGTTNPARGDRKNPKTTSAACSTHREGAVGFAGFEMEEAALHVANDQGRENKSKSVEHLTQGRCERRQNAVNHQNLSKPHFISLRDNGEGGGGFRTVGGGANTLGIRRGGPKLPTARSRDGRPPRVSDAMRRRCVDDFSDTAAANVQGMTRGDNSCQGTPKKVIGKVRDRRCAPPTRGGRRYVQPCGDVKTGSGDYPEQKAHAHNGVREF